MSELRRLWTAGCAGAEAPGRGRRVPPGWSRWARPKSAEIRDDVFSLGKILQHAVTGDLPMIPADQMPESPLRR